MKLNEKDLILPEEQKSKYYYDPNTDLIALDICEIWRNSKSFDDFVNYFNQIYTHELVHREIRNEVGLLKPSIAQEKVCVILSGEKWDKEFEEFYKEVY